jgi:hypothetical protein
MIRPLDPQAVRWSEIAIEVTRVDRTDRGRLMNDHIRLGSRHGLRDLLRIKRAANTSNSSIEDHLHPKTGQQPGL